MAKSSRGVFVRVDEESKDEIDLFAAQMQTSISHFTAMLTLIGLHHWKKALSSETDLRTIAEILIEKPS